MDTNIFIKSVQLTKQPTKDTYLLELPIVKFIAENEIVFNKPVTFIVGENGSGKSTLLEAIAVAYGFNAEGGTKNFNFETRNTVSELSDCIRLGKSGLSGEGFFLRAESFYNVATNIDKLGVSGYGDISLHEQSHGESFIALVQNRLNKRGVYLFDEPEAALSPIRIMTLLIEIDRLVKLGSQIIIATHSPMLMAYPDADIIELTEKGLTHKKFYETEHYIITKEFLNNPDKMLKLLLE